MPLHKTQGGIFLSKLAGINPDQNYWLRGLNGSSLSFVIQSLLSQTPKPAIVVASDKERAAYLQNDLAALLEDKKVLFFPESYRQPYQVEKTTNANIQERAETLNLLSRTGFNGLVVTYPQALSEKGALKPQLHQNTLPLRKGEKLSIEFIAEFLRSYHFEAVDFVFEPGQFSIRGGIIDIYSFANEFPYRVELFGNEVEAIKTFDPASQLSNAQFEFITILPNINSSAFTEQKALLLNYFEAAETLLFIEDAGYAGAVFDKKLENARKAYRDYQGEIRQVEPEKLYASSEEFFEQLHRFACLEFGVRQSLNSGILSFNQQPQPAFHKNFDLLISNLKENKTKGYRNYFLTDNVKQADRLITIFNDLLVKEHRTYESLIEYVPLNIHEGFIDEDLKVAVYTDHQIFERYHRFRLKELKYKSAEAFTLKELLALNPGDYVTHIDHGIGRFAGLQKLNINGKEQESVKLLFRDNDVLYVSIHSLHRISKFSGKEGQVPRIDKLGSTTWQTLKNKTKRNVKELAYDLIKLYAERKAKPGHAFPQDNYLQHELEASFIYEDTPDQLKVTKDVKRDMEKPHPMD